jgi:hypothetical protein
MTAVVFEHHGAAYTVRFPYNADVVELIKTVVPSYARTWHPAVKTWAVDATYAHQLAATLRRLGHTVVGIDEPSRDVSCQGWAQHLFRAVGPSRSTAVYRALSRCLHPDTPTGDTTLQRELNAAFAELPPNERRSP